MDGDTSPPPDPEAGAPAWRTWLTRLVRWGVTALLVWFLYAALAKYYEQYRAGAVQLDIGWHWVWISLVFQTAGYYLFGLAWHAGFTELGGRVPWARSVRIWAVVNLWKYLPVPGGKFVLPFARMAGFRSEGTRGALVLCGFALESVSMLVVGFVLFAITLPFQAKAFLTPEVLAAYPSARWYPWMCLIAVPLLPFLHARPLEWAVSKALKRMGREPIGLHLSGAGVARVLGWWVLAWAVTGGSFYLLALAVVPSLPPSAAVLMASSYAFSWVLAMVSFLTPAGLGFREAALGALLLPQLAPIVGFEAAGVVVALLCVGSRLWTTAADGLCILVSLVVDRLFVPPGPSGGAEQD